MTDTTWRISGGLGVPNEPSQKMTQGLGYPLRPVDNVPPPDTGDVFAGIPVAEGLFLTWAGPWQAGLFYPPGFMVTAEGWTLVSNKATLDVAAPNPSGVSEWSMPDVPVWNDESQSAVVYTGHKYTFTTDGWVRGIRIWAPTLSASTNYRVVVLDVTDPNRPTYRPIEEPVLTEDDWSVVIAYDRLTKAGTEVVLYLDALDSGSDTGINGGWTYQGTDQSLGPATGGWNNDNQQITLRISKTDLDAGDRSTELLGAIPGTTFLFTETLDPNYSVNYITTGEPVDSGTYVTYAVLVNDTGPAGTPRTGNTTTMSAAVPIPLPTDYVELPGGVPTPSWATVEGFKQFDGVDQGGTANGYGVDFLFEEAVFSPDWDLASVPGV